MRYYEILVWSVIMMNLFFICGCSKDDSVIRIFDDQPSSSGNDTIRNDTVYYTPLPYAELKEFLEVPVLSKAVDESAISLSKDAIVHLFVYREKEEPDTHKPYSKALYRVDSKGLLIPVYNALQLPSGKYNMYMVSVFGESKDKVPLFSEKDGLSDYVYNNQDYLWGSLKNVEIRDGISPNLYFLLTHMCCRFSFAFDYAPDNTKIELLEIHLSSGEESECSWSLATGLINPALTISSSKVTGCKINNDKAEATLLPLQTDRDLILSVRYKIQDELKAFEILIPPAYGKIFQYGYRYQYDIIIYPDRAILK